jgi:hypothetical protein
MQSSWTQPGLNLFGSILRGLLRIQIPSFPNAPIGNPEKTHALTVAQMLSWQAGVKLACRRWCSRSALHADGNFMSHRTVGYYLKRNTDVLVAL